MNVDNLHQPESSYSSFLNSEKLVMVHHNICLRAARGNVRVAFLPIAYSNSKDAAVAVFICLKSGKVLFQCRQGMVISVSYSILGCSYGAGASIISRGINFNPETRKKILITHTRNSINLISCLKTKMPNIPFSTRVNQRQFAIINPM